jgi:hypothetical protein
MHVLNLGATMESRRSFRNTRAMWCAPTRSTRGLASLISRGFKLPDQRRTPCRIPLIKCLHQRAQYSI